MISTELINTGWQGNDRELRRKIDRWGQAGWPAGNQEKQVKEVLLFREKEKGQVRRIGVAIEMPIAASRLAQAGGTDEPSVKLASSCYVRNLAGELQ